MINPVRYPSQIPLFDALRGDRVILRPHTPDDFDELWDAIQVSRDELRDWLAKVSAAIHLWGSEP